MSLLDGHVDRSNKTDLTNLGIRLRLPAQEENEAIYNEIRNRYLGASNGVPLRQDYTTYIEEIQPTITVPSRCSINYWREGDINSIFPENIGNKLKENVKKFVDMVLPEQHKDAISVYAPGLYYPGVEFDIKSDFSVEDGFYVIGEGTGQFRGILQAFTSGLLCAESIAEHK